MAPSLRLGLMDCDTSHAYRFARRLNHVGIEESRWVDGARAVVACPRPAGLLEAVVPALGGGPAPVAGNVEVVAFQKAALASRVDDGRSVGIGHGG